MNLGLPQQLLIPLPFLYCPLTPTDVLFLAPLMVQPALALLVLQFLILHLRIHSLPHLFNLLLAHCFPTLHLAILPLLLEFLK